jgi:chorismate mutase-like protein
MSLDVTRAKIDLIDQELLRLLNERAEHVAEIGRNKKEAGLEIYAPEREEKLLRKLADLNTAQTGRLPEKSIRAIFREIMSAALALEQNLKIAVLGPAGSWTHQVALNKFGSSLTYLAAPDTEGVFRLVESKQADYGVLPLEHSHDGTVHHTLDQLGDSQLQIYAQILWRADKDASATGGSAPARFIILGRRSSPRTGHDITMLMVSAPDKVGALLEVLQAFASRDVNVRQIENRPVPGAEARFFLEVAGHAEDAVLKEAVSDIMQQGATVKALGSYPVPGWVEER